MPECAYIVKNTYNSFPKNSIHIIAIDTEKQKNKRHIAVYIDGHYFITSDSGVLSLIFPKIKATEIVEIDIGGEYETELFPTKDVFIKVACHIIRGGTLSVIGHKIDAFKSFKNLLPVEINNGKTILYNENSALSFIKPKTAGVYIIHLLSDSFELNQKFIVLE